MSFLRNHYNEIANPSSGVSYDDLTDKPTIPSGSYDDLTDKPTIPTQASIDSKLSISDFTVFNSLPGLPVLDVSLAYLASSQLASMDGQRRVQTLTDPLTGNNLNQSSDSLKPILNVDSNGLEFLRFNSSQLSLEGVNTGILGGNNGNTTTFMLIVNTDNIQNQSQFNWVAGSPGSYDYNKRIGVHLPWGDGNLYVDYAAVSGGRLQIGSQGSAVTSGNISSFLYERNGSSAELWLNGTSIGSTTGLTSALDGSSGRFMIGNGNELSENCTMDFYGLFFYSRVLTAEEKQKMFLFSKKLFGV